MGEDYCWVCDAPAAGDPCPTCQTPLYQRSDDPGEQQPEDAVLDTRLATTPARFTVSPTLIAAAVIVALVLIFLVFRSGAVIS